MLKIEITRGQATGKTLESAASVIRIGRAPDSDVPLTDDHVSSDHARIVLQGERYVLSDLRSTNGTSVIRRGERVVLDDSNGREMVLETEDRVELGSGDLVVELRVRP